MIRGSNGRITEETYEPKPRDCRTRLPDTQIAFSVWSLELDSELVYVGDGGATEPSGESWRYGAELSVFYTPTDWLIVDGDYARTHARLTDMDERIPLAVEEVASLGLTIDPGRRWSGGARVRHFGSAPLIEDNSVRSDSTTVVNAKATHELNFCVVRSSCTPAITSARAHPLRRSCRTNPPSAS